MGTIRILLVEDQTLMRQGMRTLLDLEPDIEVIGEAVNGEEAVKQALQQRPDIILMDVQMPHMNGVEATAKICRAWPAARIIVLTTFDRDDYVFEGVRAGAMGYLLKDVPSDKLYETIRRVHQGEAFIQPEIAFRTLRAALHPAVDVIEPLSSREKEVLIMLAQGVRSSLKTSSPTSASYIAFRISGDGLVTVSLLKSIIVLLICPSCESRNLLK